MSFLADVSPRAVPGRTPARPPPISRSPTTRRTSPGPSATSLPPGRLLNNAVC